MRSATRSCLFASSTKTISRSRSPIRQTDTTDELRLALGVNCTLAVAAADALASTISRNYRMSVAVSDKAPEFDEVDDETMAGRRRARPRQRFDRPCRANAGVSIHLNPQPRDVLVRFRVDGVLRDQAPIDKRLQNARRPRCSRAWRSCNGRRSCSGRIVRGLHRR